MTTATPDGSGLTRELARLITGHVFLHACMAGMRMASPLLALREGYS
ncbi:MAG: major facilitator superfamily 1, partial [Ramlibacter sp.]|nr:major facilitator superfamily 1 [Ramlibacter sp.]